MMELHCAEGTAGLGDSYDDHIWIVRNPKPGRGAHEAQVERRLTTGEMPLLAELRAFLGFLQGGPPPRSSAAEGAAAVEIIAQTRHLARLEGANIHIAA